MNEKIRETWSSKVSFVLASVGSAIGLGAMWKLPYTMGQNGGGAFILLFVLFNFLVGLPLFIGELILGRESKKGVVSTFLTLAEKNSNWSMVGWFTVIVVLLILGWYSVVAGWGLLYIVLSLTDAFNGLSREEIGMSFDVFRQEGSLNVIFQIIFIVINGVILVKGLARGIEKWSKLMTSGLFIVLMALAAYSVQLPGFADAARYLLYPDFSKLTGAGVLQALSLALFTLSLAYGAVMTYGSYLKNSEDIPKIASIVVFANLVASVLIAITIFPMIFSFGFAPESGAGLIFKTLPFVFLQLPGSMVIAVIFFTLLLFAALTSSLAMFEVVVASLVDLELLTRTKAVMLSCTIVFILGLPIAVSGDQGIFPAWAKIFGSSFMETNDQIIDWLLVIIALFTTLFIGYRIPEAIRERGFMSGSTAKFFYRPWLFLVRFAVPVGVLAVMAHRAHLINF